MHIPNPSGLITLGRTFIAANRPEILFGASVVSTVSGVILAAKGGWDARGKVDEDRAQRALAVGELDLTTKNEYDAALGKVQISKKEIAQLTWINYLPAAGLTAGALGATTGLHLVHIKEKKQLAAAALMAIDQVKKDAQVYKNEVLDAIGVSKTEEPKDLQKAANKSGIAKVVHSDGEVEELYLVRDMKTQRDFWSNKARIEDALLEVNKRLSLEDTELNCFYSMAQMGTIPEGEDQGWNAGTYLGIEWDSTVRDDGRPVRTFRFTPEPSGGWDRD